MALDIEAEKRLIRGVWDAAVAALTKKDWDAYAQVWAHDPDIQVIHPAARDWTSGWDAVALKYQAFIESPVKLSARTRRFDVHVSPSGDVAWVTIEASISVNDVEHVSWQVGVFRKLNGRWQAVLGFDAALPDQAGS